MNIKILYDNSARDGFVCGWGFSALVDNETLFDTGENATSLLQNMQAFGIDPAGIRNVVLSHEDWDHVGGIVLFKQCGSINVYVPAGTSQSLKNEISELNPAASVFEVAQGMEIDSDKFVTATLGSKKKEISLVVRTKKGLALMTGCAHPGLDVIMDTVGKSGDIHAVIGGFHGFRKLKDLADIPVIIPCHCTKKQGRILAMYPEQAHAVSAGTEIRIGEEHTNVS